MFGKFMPRGYSINIINIELCSFQEDIRQTCHLKCLLNKLDVKTLFAFAFLANILGILG